MFGWLSCSFVEKSILPCCRIGTRLPRWKFTKPLSPSMFVLQSFGQGEWRHTNSNPVGFCRLLSIGIQDIPLSHCAPPDAIICFIWRRFVFLFFLISFYCVSYGDAQANCWAISPLVFHDSQSLNWWIWGENDKILLFQGHALIKSHKFVGSCKV